MIVENQLVSVKIAGKNIKHYQQLGYSVKYNDIIDVPVEHLTIGCHSKIKLICDHCGVEFERIYKTNLKCRESHPGLDYCNYCSKTFLNNVSHLMENDEYKRKKDKTCLEKYGCINPSSSEYVREKVRQTSLKKFGDTSILGRNSNKRNQIDQKIKDRPIEEWEKIKHKQNLTFFKNGTGKVSQQQKKIYEIIKEKYPNAILNYPVNKFLLDIYIEQNNIKLDIEYDGWYWHQDKMRDLRRDKILQNKYNTKVLRIKSGELLPNKDLLFEKIDYLLNTEHRFVAIQLDDWKEVG